MTKTKYIAEYQGFLKTIRREFDSKERAETWARQVGQFNNVKISAVK